MRRCDSETFPQVCHRADRRVRASDVEHRGDEFHALVRLTKEVALGALDRQLRCGHNLCTKFVLQAVDEDIVSQCGWSCAARRADERQADGYQKEGQSARPVLGTASACQGKGDVTVCCTGEPLEPIEAVYRAIRAGSVWNGCRDRLRLRNVRSTGALGNNERGLYSGTHSNTHLCHPLSGRKGDCRIPATVTKVGT